MDRLSRPQRSLGPLATALLPQVAGLQLVQIERDRHVISLALQTTSATAPCPHCHTLAHRIHSRYTRRMADLPWGEVRVQLRLHCRKFFCRCPACPRRIFAERLPTLVAPYARRTLRQGAIVTLVALALGARPGSRLAARLHIRVSPSTMLRRVRQLPGPDFPTPRVLGVDDFVRPVPSKQAQPPGDEWLNTNKGVAMFR